MTHATRAGVAAPSTRAVRAAPAGAADGDRGPDGRVTVGGAPDAADRCVAPVARRDPGEVRPERDRLSVQTADGAAVYVPVGPSSRPGYTGARWRRRPNRTAAGCG